MSDEIVFFLVAILACMLIAWVAYKAGRLAGWYAHKTTHLKELLQLQNDLKKMEPKIDEIKAIAKQLENNPEPEKPHWLYNNSKN